MKQSDFDHQFSSFEREAIDHDGLLCALVLVPATYSRNQNFQMYQDPGTRAVLRRARLVRALIRELRRPEEKTFSAAPAENGVILTLEIPALQFRRRAMLSPLEHDLIVYLLAKSGGFRADEAARRVERALARLALNRSESVASARPAAAESAEEECSGGSGS